MSLVNYLALYSGHLWKRFFFFVFCKFRLSERCCGTATQCVYSHYLSASFIKLAKIFTPSQSTTAGGAKFITRATHFHFGRAYLKH